MDKSNLNINSSLDDIFYNIGDEMSVITAFPKSKSELIDLGKKWFELNKKKIKTSLCGDEKLNEIILNKKDDMEVVAAVADILTSLAISIPPFTVSLLVFKYGLNKLCSE